MTGHTPGFYHAQRGHTSRVRSFRRLPAQYQRVAWALSECFNSIHGIAFISMDALGALAGGVDRRDVSRTLDALVQADCIRPVPRDELTAAIGLSPSGRSPRGFRMVITQGDEVTPEMARLVHRAPAPDADRRFVARSDRVKSPGSTGGAVPPQPDDKRPASYGGAMPPKLDAHHLDGSGGKVPPKADAIAVDQEWATSGGRNVEFRGHSARPIDYPIGEGAALRASAYAPAVGEYSVQVDLTDSMRGMAGSPDGARLPSRFVALVEDMFGEMSTQDEDGFVQLIQNVGRHEVETRLRAHKLRLVRLDVDHIAAGLWLRRQGVMERSDAA